MDPLRNKFMHIVQRLWEIHYNFLTLKQIIVNLKMYCKKKGDLRQNKLLMV